MEYGFNSFLINLIVWFLCGLGVICMDYLMNKFDDDWMMIDNRLIDLVFMICERDDGRIWCNF